MRYSCVIFDLDGTLIDSKKDLVISMNHALTTLNLKEQKPETVYQYIGWGLRHLVARLVPDNDQDMVDEAIRIFRAHYREHCLDNTRFIPGALDILEALNGCKLAVVTNKSQEASDYVLERMGILDKFGSVLGGDSVDKMKPHPEPILKTLEMLDVKDKSAIMIGDSAMDVQSGKAAGIATCGLKDGIGSLDDLIKTEPDYIIDSLDELKEILF